MKDVEQDIRDEEHFGAIIRSNPDQFDLEERIDGAIEEGYGDPDFELSDVAAAVDRSERRIREILAAEPDSTSFQAEVERRRMQRAEKLLKETKWAIEMIAAQCGYRSASSFTRRFRLSRNETPIAFRTRHGGPARAGGPTGAFRKPAERHRAAERGLPAPSMRRTTELPGEREARDSEIRHAARQAELRGEPTSSIADLAAAWGRKTSAKRGDRGV